MRIRRGRPDNVAKRQWKDRALTVPIAVDAQSILSRRLCAPGRRPSTAQPLAAAKSRDDDLPRPAGIVINNDLTFQRKSPGKAIAIGVGGEIEGEKVAAISTRDVLIAGPKGGRITAATAPLPPLTQPTNLQPDGIPRPCGGVSLRK